MEIKTQFLEPEEKKKLQILAVLAHYRELLAKLREGEDIPKPVIDRAVETLNLTEEWRERAVPLRVLKERFENQIADSTLRVRAAAGDIRAEKRYGDWYYDPEDVRLWIATSKRRGGATLGEE